ncbi:MAG: GNAT family N-acetyltransferase [Hamadaea sp.]|nr:GNAT family N-acetyltransferase [Hamadaea sp.]
MSTTRDGAPAVTAPGPAEPGLLPADARPVLLAADDLTPAAPELAEVLADVVEGGASVGFVQPFTREQAHRWWLTVQPGVASGATLLLVARDAEGIAGTVQVKLELTYPNGRHRGEIAKLLVHRRARGRGLGRTLLAAAERAAADHGVTLLMLDTETGKPAERLYRSAGWIEVGVVPDHSASPDGGLRPTTFFYKQLPVRG